jgi:alpha-galactosidase
MTSSWGVAQADRGISGTPITIGGKHFSRGVDTHAESKLRVDLGGKATRFFAQVGVDDSAGGHGSVEFIVSGDGKVLWRSGLLVGGNAAMPVDVNVGGVRVLALRVTDGADGSDSDHADWAEAGIEMQAGAPAPTTLPPYETFALKTKSFTLDFASAMMAVSMARPRCPTNDPPQRFDEAYPQWGDGYIWEPALQVAHADGNTSTALLYDSATRTNEPPDRELLRIKLRDPAYPFEVMLCFRAHRQRDLLEQWT